MTLRFGLIGSGLAGPLFGGAFVRQPAGAELHAVSTRHEATARKAATKWGAHRWYDDWRDLVADPDLDAVCIATPTCTHAPIAIAAATAGKHVLTEKPIACTLADADAMIEASARASTTLGVIFMYRFMDSALEMKRAIEDGKIGQPILGDCIVKFFRDQAYYDSGDWRGSWDSEGGGSLMTQASHTLDLLLWMLGDVREVAGFWTTTPTHEVSVDDLVVGSLRFAGGALGSLISSTAIRPPHERVLTIHGDMGTIELKGDRISRWDIPAEKSPSVQVLMENTQTDRGDTTGRAGYADPELHYRQIEDFVRAVEEGGPPKIDGLEGRRTLEVIRALYRSSNENQVIQLPLKEDR